MTTRFGEKSPIIYARAERPTLLERLRDLPAAYARFMSGGRISRDLFIFVLIAYIALMVGVGVFALVDPRVTP